MGTEKSVLRQAWEYARENARDDILESLPWMHFWILLILLEEQYQMEKFGEKLLFYTLNVFLYMLTHFIARRVNRESEE